MEVIYSIIGILVVAVSLTIAENSSGTSRHVREVEEKINTNLICCGPKKEFPKLSAKCESLKKVNSNKMLSVEAQAWEQEMGQACAKECEDKASKLFDGTQINKDGHIKEIENFYPRSLSDILQKHVDNCTELAHDFSKVFNQSKLGPLRCSFLPYLFHLCLFQGLEESCPASEKTNSKECEKQRKIWSTSDVIVELTSTYTENENNSK